MHTKENPRVSWEQSWKSEALVMVLSYDVVHDDGSKWIQPLSRDRNPELYAKMEKLHRAPPAASKA